MKSENKSLLLLKSEDNISYTCDVEILKEVHSLGVQTVPLKTAGDFKGRAKELTLPEIKQKLFLQKNQESY